MLVQPDASFSPDRYCKDRNVALWTCCVGHPVVLFVLYLLCPAIVDLCLGSQIGKMCITQPVCVYINLLDTAGVQA